MRSGARFPRAPTSRRWRAWMPRAARSWRRRARWPRRPRATPGRRSARARRRGRPTSGRRRWAGPPGEVGIVPRRGAAAAAAAGGQPPADVDGYVLAGASLSARLLPLVAAFPWLLDDQTRALAWAELLLAEDPTSPDVLELVAVILGPRRPLRRHRADADGARLPFARSRGWDRARRRRVGAGRAAARGVRAVDPRGALAGRSGGSGVAHGARVRAARSGRGRLRRRSATTSSAARARTARARSPPSWTGGPPAVDGGAADATRARRRTARDAGARDAGGQ